MSVTSILLSLRFSAISKPINPPPIIMAFLGSFLMTNSLILKLSSTVLSSKILSVLFANLIASLPGESINLS